LFALVIKISFGRRRDFRVKMWGTSLLEEKLADDLGNVIEGRAESVVVSQIFSKGKLAPSSLRLFQQHRHQAAVVECPLYVGFWRWRRLNECIARTATCDPERTLKRLSIEQCDGSGPARGSTFHLVGKAGNGEAVSRELFEITKLFHVTVGNFASGLVSL